MFKAISSPFYVQFQSLPSTFFSSHRTFSLSSSSYTPQVFPSLIIFTSSAPLSSIPLLPDSTFSFFLNLSDSNHLPSSSSLYCFSFTQVYLLLSFFVPLSFIFFSLIQPPSPYSQHNQTSPFSVLFISILYLPHFNSSQMYFNYILFILFSLLLLLSYPSLHHLSPSHQKTHSCLPACLPLPSLLPTENKLSPACGAVRCGAFPRVHFLHGALPISLLGVAWEVG